MKEIQFTEPFKSRLKKLKKRYGQIKQDIEPLINELQQGKLIGNQITGVSKIIYKARAKNSDIPTGKSGGYRLIYQVVSGEIILLLIIYAKSDQNNISVSEIEKIVKEINQ